MDGSFTTGKPEPGDVDLIVVLPADHDFSVDLRPFEYNLVSKKRVQKQGYPFDLFVVAAGSPKYHEALTLFRQVKNRAELTKGLLKVRP